MDIFLKLDITKHKELQYFHLWEFHTCAVQGIHSLPTKQNDYPPTPQRKEWILILKKIKLKLLKYEGIYEILKTSSRGYISSN